MFVFAYFFLNINKYSNKSYNVKYHIPRMIIYGGLSSDNVLYSLTNLTIYEDSVH